MRFQHVITLLGLTILSCITMANATAIPHFQPPPPPPPPHHDKEKPKQPPPPPPPPPPPHHDKDQKSKPCTTTLAKSTPTPTVVIPPASTPTGPSCVAPGGECDLSFPQFCCNDACFSDGVGPHPVCL